MSVSRTVGRSVVALTIALAPAAGIAFGTADVAFAKGGNGGGGGNGNGGGTGKGGGNGNGGSHGKGHSTSGKQGKAGKSNRDAGDVLKSLFTRGTTKTKKTIKSAKNPKTGSIATIKSKSVKSDTAGLSSLKRNYHAYLNSNDPRMVAISAYVIAYAEFEAEFGPDAVPTDPALSDEALREALERFTREGVVTDDALLEAKEVLGVGPAFGKIDQVRETLPEPAESELEVAE